VIRLPQLSHRAESAGDDSGFTIIEVVMAIALVTIVMTALAAFFVNSASATDSQGQKQTAVQVAADAIDKARSLTGVGLLNQRDKATSDAQWADATTGTNFPGVAPYLSAVTEAYDTTSGLATNSGYNASLPTDGNTVSLDNLTFTQNWFVGYCYSGQLTTGGACTATTGLGVTKYLQVVVAVTWKNKACRNSLCSYVTATLISPTPDPLFDANQSAPKPRVTNPGNQVNDVGQLITLPLGLSGGTVPITWSVSALPAGLTLVPGATSTVITGTTTAATATPVNVVVKVVDGFGFVSTAAFTWTVNARPSLTNPGAQIDTKTGALSLALAETGGSPTLTYTATGLPTGLAVDSATGTISGTPTATGTWPLVIVTVKDAVNITSTATFSWTVVAPPSVNQPSSIVVAEGAAPSIPVTYTCTNGPCTISLTNSVPGIGLSSSIDANTDNSSATSLTVGTGSGTVYLTGRVQNSAVPGTATTSTGSYTPLVKITDSSSVVATDSESWTTRTTPTVTWPGDVSVARTSSAAQAFTYTCATSCTVTVTGAPSGVGLSSSASTNTVSAMSETFNGPSSFTGTYYLTGEVAALATLGPSTVTLTVTNTIGGSSYTISSVGVWTVR
jgi:prepilin-type N-terminal cleavage/methylation domain-containing protein